MSSWAGHMPPPENDGSDGAGVPVQDDAPTSPALVVHEVLSEDAEDGSDILVGI